MIASDSEESSSSSRKEQEEEKSVEERDMQPLLGEEAAKRDLESVSKLKERLGFAQKTEESDLDRSGDEVAVWSGKSDVKSDLTCALCLGTLYKPVVVSCGHAFCRLCLLHAKKNMSSEFYGRFRCPTCRKVTCSKCLMRFSVASSLWKAIIALFPDLPAKRKEEEEVAAFEKLWKEVFEMESEDNRAMKVRMDETILFSGCDFKRTVVRRHDDLSMHLTLGLRRHPDPFPSEIRQGKLGSGKRWRLSFVLMELEEDEDGGFPPILAKDTDEEQFLVSQHISETLSVELHVDDGDNLQLVCSHECEFQNGECSTVLSLPASSKDVKAFTLKVTALVQKGMAIQIRYQKNEKAIASQSYNKAAFRAIDIGNDNFEYIEFSDKGGEHSGDEEEEDMDEFEDDGFVVNDDDDIIYESDPEVDSEDEEKKKTRKLKRRIRKIESSDDEEAEHEQGKGKEVDDQRSSSSSGEELIGRKRKALASREQKKENKKKKTALDILEERLKKRQQGEERSKAKSSDYDHPACLLNSDLIASSSDEESY